MCSTYDVHSFVGLACALCLAGHLLVHEEIFTWQNSMR